MLILSNIKQDMEFAVSMVNGRAVLSGGAENVRFVGREASIPCNYCVVTSADGVIDMESAVDARVVVFETVYETGVVHKEGSFDELMLSFGSKRSAEMVAKREIDGRLHGAVRFAGRNLILPPVNENAKGLADCFVLENMFPQSVLSKFSGISLGSVVLHADLMSFKQNIEYKMHFLLADCIIKLMEKKYVTSDCLSDTEYEGFFEVIRDEVEGRKLTPLCRDRLAVLCYILLLQIEGLSVCYRDLPDFKLGREKVINMFKAIGCSFSPQKEVFKVVARPRDASRQ